MRCACDASAVPSIRIPGALDRHQHRDERMLELVVDRRQRLRDP